MEEADPVVIPVQVKGDIKEYVRIDDGLKEARGQMKEARAGMKQASERIIEYMRAESMDKFSLKKGEQLLILQEKTLKVRPDAEVVKTKLRELLAEGKTDPTYIWDEIQKCGGTKTVWKLSRRAKRKASAKSDRPKKRARTESPASDDA